MKTYRFKTRDGSYGYVSADDIIAAIEWAMLSHGHVRADIIAIEEVAF